jgi:hypothetical protein
MNERIAKFAYESGLFDGTKNSPVDAAERFATLIINECERVAKDPKHYDESPSCGWGSPIRYVCSSIKEHFGVK